MSAAETGTNAPLTSDQVLDELGFLTTVCHAVLVEALTIQGAAGRDLPADQFGPINDQADGLAQVASSIALGEMFRLKRLNDALLAAGRAGETGRATSISSDSVPEISLAPLTPEQFIDIVPREVAIGQAIGERYGPAGAGGHHRAGVQRRPAHPDPGRDRGRPGLSRRAGGLP